MSAAGAGVAAPARRIALGSGWVLGAVGLGLVYPASAYYVSPLALPLALVALLLAAVTLSRPEVGIAVAIFLSALNPGLAGSLPWLPGTAWTAFVFLISVGKLGAERGWGHRLPPLGFVALVFVAVDIVGLVLSESAGDGVPILRSAVTGVMLMFAIAAQVRTRRQAEWVVGGLVAGAALIGGYGTWQYLTGAPTSVGFLTASGELISRATAGFDQPNQLAGFLVLLVPFALAGAIVNRRLRIVFVVAGALAVVGVYASFSRAALVALAITPLMFRGGRALLLVVPVVAVLGIFATPTLVSERFETLTAQGSEIATRTDFWRTAGDIWTRSPLAGAGLGEFPAAYAQSRVPGRQFLPASAFQPPPHAHNLELQLLAEQGLLGLMAFLAVLGVAVSRGLALLRSHERWISVLGSAILAALAAFVIHNQFDVTLYEGTGVYFWAILGLLAALTIISSDERPADA